MISCDEVRRFKPHPAAYEHGVREVGSGATLVAAHGWDVVGARAAGLEAIWVDREERAWPFPLAEPRRARDLLDAVEQALADAS